VELGKSTLLTTTLVIPMPPGVIPPRREPNTQDQVPQAPQSTN
jgi:hypothetical protein